MPSYRLTYDDFGHPWLNEEISGCFPHEQIERPRPETDHGWTLSPGASDCEEPPSRERARSTPFQFAGEAPA